MVWALKILVNLVGSVFHHGAQRVMRALSDRLVITRDTFTVLVKAAAAPGEPKVFSS